MRDLLRKWFLPWTAEYLFSDDRQYQKWLQRRYASMRTARILCDLCGWEYDEEAGYPEGGIAPGTKWEDVPEDFECPMCSVGKDQFSPA